MLQRELKNEDFAKRKIKIGWTVSEPGPDKVWKSSKMTRIRTLRLVYFSCKIDFEQPTNKNIVDLDLFFYAESETGNGFGLWHLDFAGLPDSIEPGNPKF